MTSTTNEERKKEKEEHNEKKERIMQGGKVNFKYSQQTFYNNNEGSATGRV